jgi:hypothetical protein
VDARRASAIPVGVEGCVTVTRQSWSRPVDARRASAIPVGVEGCITITRQGAGQWMLVEHPLSLWASRGV